MRLLFLLFITLPILEMIVLLKVGSLIGAGYTILAVLATAFAGAWLLRRYSIQMVIDIQRKISRGELPAKTMLEGVFLAVGGALLLTPGFITDAIGFACLLPPSRSFMTQWLIDRGMIKVMGGSGIERGENSEYYGSKSHQDNQSSAHKPTTIEGEYHRED